MLIFVAWYCFVKPVLFWRTLPNFYGGKNSSLTLAGAVKTFVHKPDSWHYFNGRPIRQVAPNAQERRPSHWDASQQLSNTVARDRVSDSEDCYVLVVLFYLFFSSTDFSSRFSQNFATRRGMS